MGRTLDWCRKILHPTPFAKDLSILLTELEEPDDNDR